MTLSADLIASRSASALLVSTMALAAWNWYLMPERAASWAAALVFLVAITVVFAIASRSAARQAEDDSTARRRAAIVRTTVVFTSLLLAFSLGLQLATTIGVIDAPDLKHRGTMVFIGFYFVLTGNQLPKMLTPLSELRCDGTRTQAFQRFTGWAWVLMGLSYVACWLILPLDVAKSVSVAVLVAGMLAVVIQTVRLHRTRRKDA